MSQSKQTGINKKEGKMQSNDLHVCAEQQGSSIMSA
jgi:hypothetical protein